jgi:hypothetical protein
MFRSEIKRIVAALREDPPRPSRDAILRLLEKLADPDDAAFRQRFAADPAATLREFKIPAPADIGRIEELPPAERYREVLEALKSGRGFGRDLGEPGVGGLLATLGTLGTLGMMD